MGIAIRGPITTDSKTDT